MNDSVIEITSSPDVSFKSAVRAAPRCRRSKTRTRRAQVDDADIELTDSDNNVVDYVRDYGSRRQPNTPEGIPAAGPSGAGPAKPAPLFYPDTDNEETRAPDAGLSRMQNDASFLGPGAVVILEQDAFVPVAASEPGSLLEDVPQVDPLDAYVSQVLEIVPDVLPEHVRELIERHLPAHQQQVVETVLHILFEDPTYPKVDLRNKGKRKREVEQDDAEKNAKLKVDYACTDRIREGGPSYDRHALGQLYLDFPQIPVQHVRGQFALHKSFYAPTFLFLSREMKLQNLPYKRKAVATRRGGKGKAAAHRDPEVEKEIEWVKMKLLDDGGLSGQASEQVEAEDEEDGIECGCCFSTYGFSKMIQCPEAHLFCPECMTSYASNLLGSHDANIVCMDQSGCKLPFPESELRRFLSPKLLGLYDRVKQRKEIEAAGIDNLEECPFCEYKCVIENEHEKLFRCENQECLAITCRQCKKPDHLPRSCQEVENDKKLDIQHAVEEAMTRALMRNCPKCQKAFIKEMGCNKMTCPNCRTTSCYVCREIITGYEHFNNPPPYSGHPDPKKCTLWDSVDQRHSDEVTAAAKKAIEDFKKAHPELADDDIKVDLPPPPPVAGPSNLYAVPGVPPAPQVHINVPPHIQQMAHRLREARAAFQMFEVGHQPRVGRLHNPQPRAGFPPHPPPAMFQQALLQRPVQLPFVPPPPPAFHAPRARAPRPPAPALILAPALAPVPAAVRAPRARQPRAVKVAQASRRRR
ncbi:uncharacterized protein FIBRA_02577 [Fibroporia radiculosa]|uniref:RING-type domain-containing protein n=1 Tax=Fibroporia radiculosa TaxID=599839 RepID=J4G1W9_9APHY|nr:uncharacterized protein FIBRA_02577 [Fibroporia radiculosa]CCM00543.1 predicted protein [Fibroporia radiculosa]